MSTVLLLNPLPSALKHYAQELKNSTAPTVWRDVSSPGVEAGATGNRASRAAAHVRAAARTVPDLPLLVAWPAFGHAEPLLHRRAHAPRALVVHDPTPLRPQFGHGALARCLGPKVANKRDQTLVVHSERAAGVLRQLGYRDVVRLPLPMRTPARVERGPGPAIVRVLGQYKTARDRQVLSDMAPLLARAGLQGEIVGRGWPAVPGWSVRSEFVPEPEFAQLLETSAAVVVPYSYFFQSDVAVRAAELGVPVVGPSLGHLAELFGDAYAGLVTSSHPEAWVAAVEEVIENPESARQAGMRAFTGAREQWLAFLDIWATS